MTMHQTNKVKDNCRFPLCKNKGLWKVKGKYYCIGHANLKEGIYDKEMFR